MCIRDSINAEYGLGDLCKTSFAHIQHMLPVYIPVLIENIYPASVMSVCNNAMWAIGEISLRVGPAMKPYALTIMQRVVPIIKHDDSYKRMVLENGAITLGRLGLACPEVLAPFLNHFTQSMCLALRGIPDDKEKEDAFRGLCAMIKINPNGILNDFFFVLDAFASWYKDNLSSELQQLFSQILREYKTRLGSETWTGYFVQLPEESKQSLHEAFGV
eukprot:TRINITY_DN9733_c0_g1_i3.p1 TRINITY_DN9733_c0_g1~~TRINITY_DN9733_c0_g1_i3.p1  ORF type:complete len:217 (-),score=29.38 TRINITY_DN9733_c0_g1_i3:68-718(-)